MSALQRLWKDVMDIYHTTTQTDTDGTTITVNPDSSTSSGVKCHYSKGSLSETGTEGIPTIVNNHSLFCGLETAIQEGDKVIVTQQDGRQISLTVGEGFPYSDHQEFKVSRSDTA